MFGKSPSSKRGDWDFYPLLVDDKAASIFVNLEERLSAPDPVHDHMGYVRIELRTPRDDGLSSQEEFEALMSLEDDIRGFVERKGRARFVGRNTSSGQRDFYFYTRTPQAFLSAVDKRMKRHPGYRYEKGVREDKNWSTYFSFLLPSPSDMQRIMNRRVCDRLVQNGDQIDVPREIDHLAYLPSETAMRSFESHLNREGFSIRNCYQAERPGPVYAVDFNKVDRPDDMDSVVLAIIETLSELSGEYDGWGCSVVPIDDKN